MEILVAAIWGQLVGVTDCRVPLRTSPSTSATEYVLRRFERMSREVEDLQSRPEDRFGNKLCTTKHGMNRRFLEKCHRKKEKRVLFGRHTHHL